MNKAIFVGTGLLLVLAACGGDGGSSAPPVVLPPAPTPAPTPTPTPPPTPTPTPSPFVLTADINYGSGATASGSIPLLLDVYRPQLACDAPRPTVVFIHGGGFSSGSRKGASIEAIAQALSQRGINTLSISYRLVGDNPVISSEFAAFERDFQALNTTAPPAQVTAFSAAVEDAVRALRWAVSNAGTYCIDPTRFGVWGGSAGAITAMHVAYSLDEYAIPRPPVRVAVDYWGALLRVSDLDAGEPPLFALHGTLDGTVAYSSAVQLTDQAQRVGVPFTFYSIIGGGHGFDGTGFFSLTVDGQSIATRTATFVDAHMRAGGLPVYERRDIPR